MIFKTLARRFCVDVHNGRTFDRDYALKLLKCLKRKSGLTYGEIAKQLSRSEIYVASVLNGEHPLSDEQDFEKIYQLFHFETIAGLDKESIRRLLNEVPVRAQNEKLNRDPTVYRLSEIVSVYGYSIKELIEEKAGNGIMSAIDCKIDVQVVEDEQKNKRIELKINGKFLAYDC